MYAAKTKMLRPPLKNCLFATAYSEVQGRIFFFFLQNNKLVAKSCLLFIYFTIDVSFTALKNKSTRIIRKKKKF